MKTPLDDISVKKGGVIDVCQWRNATMGHGGTTRIRPPCA